jgi:hypothetical protein
MADTKGSTATMGTLLCPAGLDWSNTELVPMLSIGHYADILQD